VMLRPPLLILAHPRFARPSARVTPCYTRPPSPSLPVHLQPVSSTGPAGVVPYLELDCFAHGTQVDGQVGRIGHQVTCGRAG